MLDGEWLGNITFAPTGLDNYGASVGSGGMLAVSEGAMAYTGTLTYRSLSDPGDTRETDGSIAVNCGTSGVGGGGDATAEIDGRSLVFPAGGAQSYECEVGPASARVLVNRLALEDTQIQIAASQQAGSWLGGVYVISGEERLNAVVPADGTGLDVTGTTLTFSGTFTVTSQADPTLERE